jgi:hypothetical protein
MFGWGQRRIYHGSWGSALFQSVYSRSPGKLSTLLMLPEWYLLMGVLALVSLFGTVYPPLGFALGLLALVGVAPTAHAWLSGRRACFRIEDRQRWGRRRLAAVTAWLHLLQPAARLLGRFRQGLTPWRRRGANRLVIPWPRMTGVWSEQQWRSGEQRLETLEAAMRESGAVVLRGGDYDAWDLEARGGLLGTARAQLVIEEHGQGRQLVWVKVWPMALPAALVVASLFALLAAVAALDMAWSAWALLNLPALLLLFRTFYESGTAQAVVQNALPATLVDGEVIIEGTKR